jgi:hypothetical protein
MPFRRTLLAISLAGFLGTCLDGQQPDTNAVAAPWPPPPTKLEAFQPPVGSVFTVAHEDMGNISGISVELREVRDSAGKPIRGLIVTSGTERSFVDADEIAALLRACQALLDVNGNPTQLKTYEARYGTRGSLELTAATTDRRGVVYSVKVGRFRTAGSSLTSSQMGQLRDIFAAAAEKLASLPE